MILMFLLFLWQLPQNLAGLTLYLFRHRDRHFIYRGRFVGIDDRFVSDKEGDTTHNGVSLGMFIILEKENPVSLDHEYGHCRQSEYLGWFYLPVIGAFSGIYNLVHRWKRKHNKPVKSYYTFWTECWADRLGEVKR